MISKWKYKNLEFSFIKEKQIAQIVEILHDPKVEKYLWFAPLRLEGLKGFCMPLIKQQEKAFAQGKYPGSATFIVTKNGKMLGTCGVDKIPDGHNVAMIGYQLRASAWGKGVGTSCAEFLLYYVKSFLNYRKIYGDCYTSNVASAKVLEKCGFKLEAVIKEKYELDGELHDNSWYGLNVKDIRQLSDVVEVE